MSAEATRERLGTAVRIRTVVGRVLSGLVALGALGAVAVAGTVDPVPPALAAAAPAVAVPPGESALVCPGPLRLPTEQEGDDAAYDPQFDPAPAESRALLTAVAAAPAGAASADATLSSLGEPAGAAAVALRPAGALAVTRVGSVAGPTVLRAAPSGEGTTPVAGAVLVRTPAGDLQGLAAAACQEPAGETWLVGGGTELGSSARLVLANPGRTPATVRVELWGPRGAVELAGATEYLVPAGSERAVLLEGVAAEQPRTVVRVTAAGGLVAAHLQVSTLRGLVPAGADLVVGGAAPARRQVVAGLTVPETEPGGVDVPQLRLLAPDADGTATVSLLGAEGPADLPGAGSVELRAGEVVDVPLGGVPAGDWTVVVDADVPVVAGALTTLGPDVGRPDAGATRAQPLDRAWVPAARAGAGPDGTLLALPEGAAGRLLVAAVPVPPGEESPPGDAVVQVEVAGPAGEALGTFELVVVPGRTASVDLAELDELAAGEDAALADLATRRAGPAAVRLVSDDPRVAAAVVLVAPEDEVPGVAVLAPVPPRATQPAVGVLVR